MSGPTSLLTPDRVLRRIEWRMRRRLDGLRAGDHPALLRGGGVDVADLREYQLGDDLRHVDWNVTARTGTVHVREYLPDRDVPVWLVLDCSASMAFGPVERAKHVVLAEIAAAVGQLLTGGGNRVGALLFDAQVHPLIPPGHGRDQVLRILSALLAQRPSGAATDLAGALRAAAGIARRRSLIVLVTDFIGESAWQGPLGRLAQRHDVVAVQVVDRRETELPAAGLLYVEDAETGEVLFVDSDDPGFQARLRAAADEHQAGIVADLASAGLDLHTVATDEDLVRALLRITRLRRGRR